MPEPLIATCIGARAAEALAGGPAISVRGTTSRGVYLLAQPHSIVFLTRDPTPGPFSINIAGFPAEFTRLSNGDPATFSANRLELTTEGLSISTANAPVWRTPPAPQAALSPEQRVQNLAAIAHSVLEVKGWVGLAGQLNEMLQLGLPEPPAEPDALGLSQAITNVREALSAGEAARTFDALKPAMGRGPGLTPSGDDLIAGVLLALRRSGSVLLPPDQLDDLARKLAAAAHEKTTTYSANLIEAAAAGEADERVQKAFDAVFAGIPEPPAAARAISHWGSSSGIDTLTGFSLVALAGLPYPPHPSQETP